MVMEPKYYAEEVIGHPLLILWKGEPGSQEYTLIIYVQLVQICFSIQLGKSWDISSSPNSESQFMGILGGENGSDRNQFKVGL